MQTLNTVGVQLSDAEVWFLMRTLNIPRIPGLALPELDEENMQAVDQLAFGSLLARGVVSYTPVPDRVKFTITIDTTMAALIGVGAICTRWLVASIKLTDETELETHFYFGEQLTVVHSRPRPGIHLFAVVNSGDVLFSALFGALQLENKRLNATPASFELPISLVQNAHTVTEGELIEELHEQVFSTGLSRRFAAALRGRARRVALMSTETEDVQGFHVLEDDLAYWILDTRGESVFVQEASTPDVTGAIQVLLDA